ncbi:MAG: type III-B CRISPR module-associated protein Cmr5 [Rubrobacteraceae bacterium]
MSEQTLAQRRAKHALGRINSLEGTSYGHYRSYVSALPASILTNGLGQAVATVRAGSQPGYEQLYEHLSSWLCDGDAESPYPEGDLLKNITVHNEEHYLHAQAEAMAYLEWLKKFATTFLEKGKES